jgi:hypothetical protein
MNGRCPLHGGLSTGPKTKEGKRKSALNGNCPKHKGRDIGKSKESAKRDCEMLVLTDSKLDPGRLDMKNPETRLLPI